MNNIGIDYNGLSSDINILAEKIKMMNSLLDQIDSNKKIIPDSWQCSAAEQYRNIADTEIASKVQSIKDSLNSLLTELVYVYNSYSGTENDIAKDIPNNGA